MEETFQGVEALTPVTLVEGQPGLGGGERARLEAADVPAAVDRPLDEACPLSTCTCLAAAASDMASGRPSWPTVSGPAARRATMSRRAWLARAWNTASIAT